MTASPLTFDERLAIHRASLERQELADEFIDSLDGRGGICARDAAEAYVDDVPETCSICRYVLSDGECPQCDKHLRDGIERDLAFTMNLQTKRRAA